MEKAGVPAEVIADQWPLFQNHPFTWELTPRSRAWVANVWRAAALNRTHGQHSYRGRARQVKFMKAASDVSREPVDFREAARMRRQRNANSRNAWLARGMARG